MKTKIKKTLFQILILFLILFGVTFSAHSEQEVNASASGELIDLKQVFGQLEGTFVLLNLASGKTWQYAPERCDTQYAPCSTFKIPNTIIALETEVATGPDLRIPWDGTEQPIKTWNCDQTLRSAFAESCVWYFQEIARRIGKERMQKFVDLFGYGNRDISGGIDQFWLSSSLLISPNRQVDFLRRLKSGEIAVSSATLQLLFDLMLYSDKDGVIIRGKTGSAGDPKKQIAVAGWYVGYVEYRDKNYAFATHIIGSDNPSGRHARDIITKFLQEFVPKL